MDSTDRRIHRIARATGYRRNHIRRILAVVDAPDNRVEMIHVIFKIPRDKAALIVRMAQKREPRRPWYTALLPWRT